MEVIANGQTIPFTLGEEQNAKELLQTILMLTHQADKLIMECKINGEEISLLDRSKYSEYPIGAINTVELVVQNKTVKVVESFDEMIRLFPMLIESFTEVSHLLISGQKHKALTSFSSSLDNWRKIINFLRIIEASYKLDFSEIDINGKKIDETNSELYTLLAEIKQAVENEDLVTIGDLVEYELKNRLEEQVGIIHMLKSVVQDEARKIEQQIP